MAETSLGGPLFALTDSSNIADKLNAITRWANDELAKRPAAASGSVFITPTALNTPVTAVVNFPVGRFATPPLVVVTVVFGNPATWSAGVAVVPTTTQVTLSLTQVAGAPTGRSVYWTAVEPT